ncbi:MAG: YdeI/OmpD-associated family protein [Vogesella sp.]|uniref:YdeI/OmpD-associated family protein n=1 Tax=Vogesella sp. TaxID=1904252 RepID=UPI003F32CA0E
MNSVDIETRSGLHIVAFESQASFEAWLALQSRDATGIWLKLAKKGSGIPSVSRAEAIDVALCHGWIDGQQQPFDELRWLVRFTPRRRGSKWSQVNRSRVLELIREGRVQPAGLEEVRAAKFDGRWEAAYAPARSITVPAELQVMLDASTIAAKAFASLKAGERYAILYAISNAKLPKTRTRQITRLIARLTAKTEQVQ